MWPNLQHRSAALELLDDPTIGGAELQQALAQLRVINQALGAARPTVEGVAAFWRAAGQPTMLTVLDVGTGSGDMSYALLRWAEQHGVRLQLVLVDIHPETCAAAAAAHRSEPHVTVVCSDLLQLALQPVDIVTAALFTHHFSQAQLPAVYYAMRDAARYGVVVNDLHRHLLAWAFIWLATRLLSRNRMIRHDAPLSVRRGFRTADLQHLRQAPGLSGIQFAWRPLFRYLILLPGTQYAN
jgi:SAM-dependent methyltransferase